MLIKKSTAAGPTGMALHMIVRGGRAAHNKGMPRRGAPLRGAPCRRTLGEVTVRERRRACLRSANAALRHAGDARNVSRNWFYQLQKPP